LVIVEKWLATPFDCGRHTDRLKKIKNLENRNYSDILVTELSENIIPETNIAVHKKNISGVA
jgi:hypothetical protein